MISSPCFHPQNKNSAWPSIHQISSFGSEKHPGGPVNVALPFWIRKAAQAAEALTFPTCPAGAEQQRRDQRSHPRDSFTPWRHAETRDAAEL